MKLHIKFHQHQSLLHTFYSPSKIRKVAEFLLAAVGFAITEADSGTCGKKRNDVVTGKYGTSRAGIT